MTLNLEHHVRLAKNGSRTSLETIIGNIQKKISGWVKTLQFGGTFPMGDDPDVMVWDCPNPKNRVQVELRRIKE